VKSPGFDGFGAGVGLAGDDALAGAGEA